MIEVEIFKRHWRELLQRFGKPWDRNVAAAYYAFLSEVMDTEAFTSAARAIWATATWFPRPAEFLTAHAGADWPLVLRCIDGFRPPDWPWQKPWAEMSARGQAACNRLGGMESLKTAHAKDPLRLKKAWEEAYEQCVGSEVLALPPASRPEPAAKRLRPVA